LVRGDETRTVFRRLRGWRFGFRRRRVHGLRGWRPPGRRH